MGHLDPIAYTYEADYHCPGCTEARFGVCDCGFIACPGGGPGCSVPPLPIEDSEGNQVGVVAPWDEWWNVGEDQCDTLACGTCGGITDNAHLEGCEENFGERSCTIPEWARA
jgi:hypothetical protein